MNVSLATANLTTGVQSVAALVGGAGITEYPNNPFATSAIAQARIASDSPDPFMRAAGLIYANIPVRVPMNERHFMHLYASTETGLAGYIGDFTSGAWDLFANGSDVTRARILSAPWTAASIKGLDIAATEALTRFEQMNPGRGSDTILGKMAAATHTAYMEGVRGKPNYVAYNQGVHDFIAWAIGEKLVEKAVTEKANKKKIVSWEKVDLSAHTNPKAKFKLTKDGSPTDLRFNLEGLDEEARRQFNARFEQATGKNFESDPFLINTVAGDWDDLVAIQVDGNWAAQRGSYLFGLQEANVSAILMGLEKNDILATLANGSMADRLQGLVTLLRLVNVGWRVKNPWNGMGDPLIGKPYALPESGGIPISEIVKDAVTMRTTLDNLDRALREGAAGGVQLPPAMASGIRLAYGSGLSGVLDLMVNEEALAAAIAANTAEYRPVG